MGMGLWKIFDEASNLDPEDVDACVNLWWSYSFIDGIKDKSLREKCAQSYTRMAQFLNNNRDYCTITAIPGVDLHYSSFPLVRRVITGTGLTLKDPEAFLDFCKEYLRDRVDHYDKVKTMHRIDLEAEAIRDCAEYAIKVINKQTEEECDTTTQSTDSKTTEP